nr:MAG TPA: hypothetical protein [Caudoviricetes sp.]
MIFNNKFFLADLPDYNNVFRKNFAVFDFIE